MKNVFALALCLVALVGCESPTNETLVTTPYDQQEMDEAIARARREVDTFIAELKSPTGSDHSVKAAITEGKETEHFWLTGISYDNGEFEGVIGNEPGIVGNVTYGQKWTVKKDEISDWLFMRGGKMHGNYTMRPLLKGMPESEAAQYRAMLANP